MAQGAEKIAASTPGRDGMHLFATQTDRRPDFVKDLAYSLRARSPRLVFVVGSLCDGKPTPTVMLGDEIASRGVNAGAVVREAGKLMQGGGGGQAFFATAGGKNPDGLQAAIDKAVELIAAQVKSFSCLSLPEGTAPSSACRFLRDRRPASRKRTASRICGRRPVSRRSASRRFARFKRECGMEYCGTILKTYDYEQ